MKNTKKYHINDNTMFHASENLLSDEQGCKKEPLDNLETKVLIELCDSIGRIVTKQQLLMCWPTMHNTSDNSLARIISVLRKKLKKIDETNCKVILNISKKGYRISE
ncbi:helix-turn-helix domain-containing protein [Psychromonas sp. SP041]|uniref:winged helix-turn-helix domain-containing protein n=1 Tax=Psychromonas sp. SP041 TaxID=1365007 RepID=UPI0010C7A88F|nr:helix-turn-helix domain-containing protein [Psychromonas sp. SP041]